MVKSSFSSGIVLMLLGAIARFGITAEVDGIDLDAIGILMVWAGVAILALTAVLYIIENNKTTERVDTIENSDGTVTRSKTEQKLR